MCELLDGAGIHPAPLHAAAESAGHEPGGLAQVLAAREERVRRQREFTHRFGAPLIGVCLNIPGPDKRPPFVDAALDEAMELVAAALEVEQAPVLARQRVAGAAGVEALLAVRGDPVALKHAMVRIEDDTDLGRLFDLDVLDTHGVKIDRADIGRAPRSCLLCERPAVSCARSRAHPLNELQAAVQRILHDHFCDVFANRVAAMATRALLDELAITPKPGLVDRWGNGSHTDMDYFLMNASITTLTSHYARLTRAGIEFTAIDPAHLLPRLRYLGVRAEREMLAATGNVNTHRGAIFSLGVVCAAAGHLFGRGMPPRAESLFDMAAQMAGGVLDDLQKLPVGQARTHGETLYAAQGVLGIRGEAAAGYPTVRQHALPRLRRLLDAGVARNEAGVEVLLVIMSLIEDSNMISRSDLQTAAWARSEVAQLLDGARLEDLVELAARLDEQFVTRQLSPGGAADLLALTFLVHQLDGDAVLTELSASATTANQTSADT